MRPAGRIAGAIEVMELITTRHQPAADALKEWARAHRFAGSSDRSHIGNLIYDALRRRASIAAHMGEDTPRALILGTLRLTWHMAVDSIAELMQGEHSPGALTPEEMARLEPAPATNLPDHVRGDYPEFLAASFKRVFGDKAVEQGIAMAQRAPVDLRVNTLKSREAKVIKALEKFHALAGPLSPLCVRIEAPPPPEGRNPNVEAEPGHPKGWFEIQDAGSQVAALLSAAKPGEQVVDLCAGAGGKTLALAAMMENKGQIHATDNDRHRLRPIFDRLKRAGAHNVQVIPADEPKKLASLDGKIDMVLVDAPCSGSGAWRRKPDAKWRLKPEALEARIAQQRDVLERAAQFLKPGGRLVYVTCSLLPEENTDQVETFLKAHGDFSLRPTAQSWAAAGLSGNVPTSADGRTDTLLLTPKDHATDGFFIAVMVKA
jgi:16S rRNA (cytosine967-C5)-methyltransferase